jgi:hypothetical protein
MEAPGNVPRPSLFSAFEEGTPKVSTDRSRPIAIPSSNIRPSFSGLAPRSLLPKNLGLVARRTPSGEQAPRTRRTKRGDLVLQGKRGTFVLDPNQHFGVKTWGVYQRIGPKGKKSVRLLWIYKTRVQLPRTLSFVDTVERTARQRLAANVQAAFLKAAATAR